MRGTIRVGWRPSMPISFQLYQKLFDRRYPYIGRRIDIWHIVTNVWKLNHLLRSIDVRDQRLRFAARNPGIALPVHHQNRARDAARVVNWIMSKSVIVHLYAALKDQ